MDHHGTLHSDCIFQSWGRHQGAKVVSAGTRCNQVAAMNVPPRRLQRGQEHESYIQQPRGILYTAGFGISRYWAAAKEILAINIRT